MGVFKQPNNDYVPAKVPVPGEIISVILQMSTFAVLSVCIMRRTQWITNWTALPLATWLVLIIYCDSALFVFATGIVVHGLGINSTREICEGGILLCLICYMTTKILIYYFLVEKAYIVRGSLKPRLKTKLWLFNCLGMLLPYGIFVILNFIFRITYIDEKGVCIIGMEKIAMMPLIIFEVIVNVYLTLLFVVPLRGLYSYQNGANPALKRMAFRSFIGSCATLVASAVNLTVLMVLKGEPGWICLTCCNADILFCVLVLHWVTSNDRTSPTNSQNTHSRSGAPGTDSANRSGLRSGNHGLSIVISKPGSLGNASDFKKGSPTSPTDADLSPTTPKSLAHNTIITECSSAPLPPRPTKTSRLALHRKMSNTAHNEGSHSIHGGTEGEWGDEVELNNIRVVQTITTEGMGRVKERSESVDTEEWSEGRGVVGEKMV